MNYGKKKKKRKECENKIKKKCTKPFVRNARTSIFVLDYDSNNYYIC